MSNKPYYYASIGAPAGGRQAITDRNLDGKINDDDWLTAPPVAEQIDHNNSSGVDIDDWGSLLWNCEPGKSTDFFLCSAGPDFIFNCLKVKDVNIYCGKEFAYNLFKELEIEQNVLFNSDKA